MYILMHNTYIPCSSHFTSLNDEATEPRSSKPWFLFPRRQQLLEVNLVANVINLLMDLV
jgi:hypothetical protein